MSLATGRATSLSVLLEAMFTMLALTRMAVRAGVLAALIATVMSVASGLSADGNWETLEAHAEEALDWLRTLWHRLVDIDPSVGEIQLADLVSPSGWIDLGAGLFDGGSLADDAADVLVAADG